MQRKEAVLKTLLDVRPKSGEVGIEIELEGLGLRFVQGTNFWNVEHDGSLRGEAIELVLKTPCARHLVPARLLQFSKMIEGCKILDTGRAGIHIHVNVQDLTPREYVQFLCMYLIFEDILVDFCGEGRVGNLFCLRTSDASGGIRFIRDCIQDWRWGKLGTDQIRYASVNLKATATYGSLEFRAMRSTTELPVIQKWVDILCALKDKSRGYESPAKVVEQLSIRGTEEFFNEVLGRFELPYNHRSLMDGVRNAQLLAHCREDFFVEAEERKELPGKPVPPGFVNIPQEWMNNAIGIERVDAVNKIVIEKIRGMEGLPPELRGMGQGIGPMVAPALDREQQEKIEVQAAREERNRQFMHNLDLINRIRELEKAVNPQPVNPEEEQNDED